MKQQSFDDIIKQKAQQYEAPVPADAWENIMQGKKKKRRFIFFWWILGLLLTGSGAVLLYNHQQNGKAIAEMNAIQQKEIMTNESSQKETIIIKPVIDSNKPVAQENNSTDNNAIENKISEKKDDAVLDNTNTAMEPTTSEPGTDPSNKKKSILNGTDRQERETINSNPDKPVKIPVNNRKKNKSDTKEYSVTLNRTNTLTSKKGKTTIPATDRRSTTIDEPIIIPVTPGTTTGSFPAIAKTSNTIADSSITGKKDSVVSVAATKPVVTTPTDSVKKKSSHKKRWFIDAGITPFATIQHNEPLLSLMRTETTSGYKKEFSASNIQTTVKPSLAFRLAARRQINKKLEWGAGFEYTRLSEKVKLIGTETTITYPIVQRLTTDNTGTHLVADTLENVSTGLRTINAYNSYSVFSVPVFIQYSILTRRNFSVLLTSGAYVNVVKYSNSIEGDFTAVYRSGLQPGNQPFNIGIDLFAGLRLATVPRKKYQFFAEPIIRYGLLKNNASGMINTKHIHRAGLSIGVSYNLY